MTRSYSGKVPSISLLVSVTPPTRNWMRVSESAMSTSPLNSSSSLRSSFTVLRGTMTPGIPPAPSGSGSSTRASRCPSVATARSTCTPSLSVGVQVDAVEVVARFLGGDREARAVDQAAQRLRESEKRCGSVPAVIEGKSSVGSTTRLVE